jgi:quercetin dioxygenase-like cupin family protein
MHKGKQGGKMMEKEEKKNAPEGLGAGVNRLVDLVAYQRGSVVSRTIIDKKTGTVTLFSFDEGQGLSEHTAPFDALVYLLDGEADISISGKPLHLREGEMVIMPANQPHALKAVKRFKMLLAMIRS